MTRTDGSSPPEIEDSDARAALAHRPPLRVPVVPLSLPRQILLLAVALITVLPLPLLGLFPSPYSPHANPMLGLLGAMTTSLITFTMLHLWVAPLAGLYVFAVALWCSVVDALGPVGVIMLAGLVAGCVLHVCVRASVREDHHVTLTGASIAVTVLGVSALSGWVHGYDAFARLHAIAEQIVRVSVDLFAQQLSGTGPSAQTTQFIEEMREMSADYVWLLPGKALALFTIALYVLSRFIRRRMPGASERLPPFWAYGVGMLYVYPVIALCLLDAAAVLMDITLARLILDNALWFLLNLYWLAGLAVAHCVMLQLRFGIIMRVWTWIVMLFLLQHFIAAVGLFDTWFHFRRLGAKLATRERS